MFLAVAQSGCLLAAGGAAAGIIYTTSNTAVKTFAFPVAEVEAAIHQALKDLDIRETGAKDTGEGRKIWAETEKVEIELNLVRSTSQITKVEVDARKKGLAEVRKDKEMAKTVLVRISEILSG